MLFWIAAAWPFYVYALYPALLYSLARLLRHGQAPRAPAPASLPQVSMVISAFNEAPVLEQKIRNCKALDYPPERLEFLLGSDGSDDSTASVARGAAGQDPRFRVFEFRERSGKASVLNRIIPEARGEIVIFSDANTLYEPGSIRALVRHFADPRVGAVCGRLVLETSRDRSCREESLYWRYETAIKTWESSLNISVSVNGQIFAVRRDLAEPLPAEILNEDQLRGERLLARGFDLRFEPQAVGREGVSTLEGEFARHVRIAAGNFQNLGRVWPQRLLHRPLIWWAYLSHKAGRWLTPGALLAAYVLSARLALSGWRAFGSLLALQSGAYGIAALCQVYPRLRRWTPLRLWHYFVLINLAQVLGLVQILTGRARATWSRAVDFEAPPGR